MFLSVWGRRVETIIATSEEEQNNFWDFIIESNYVEKNKNYTKFKVILKVKQGIISLINSTLKIFTQNHQKQTSPSLTDQAFSPNPRILNAVQMHDGRKKAGGKGACWLAVYPCEDQNVLLALCYMLAWQQ